MPAMAAASSEPPRRCFSSSGAENARWSGTCWSSTNPIRSASGSRAISSSAAASPVKCSRSGLVVATAPS
jgi:hypothetical protein